jgi:hypothetical protein
MPSQASARCLEIRQLVTRVAREYVRNRNDFAQRFIGDPFWQGIALTKRGRASRGAQDLALQVPQDRGNIARRVIRTRSILQSPLLNSPVNLTKVVEAGALLRRAARTDEVGNGDRGQQTNDGDDDHHFHQREALDTQFSAFHSNFTFLSFGVNPATGGII